jgi:hypothetical protein
MNTQDRGTYNMIANQEVSTSKNMVKLIFSLSERYETFYYFLVTMIYWQLSGFE